MSALGARSRCSLAPEPHSPLRRERKKEEKIDKKEGRYGRSRRSTCQALDSNRFVTLVKLAG